MRMNHLDRTGRSMGVKIFSVFENESFILGTHSVAAKQPITTEAISKSNTHSYRSLFFRVPHSEYDLRRRTPADAMCVA